MHARLTTGAVRSGVPAPSLVFFVVLSLCGAAGCDLGSPPSPKVPRGADGRTCAERLVGSWRVVGFTPETLPTAAQQAQLQTVQSSLRLSFDGKMATTSGPGVQSGSPYRVDSDDGIGCRVTAPDTTGALSEKLVRFPDPNHMEVIDKQSATPGRATLERLP